MGADHSGAGRGSTSGRAPPRCRSITTVVGRHARPRGAMRRPDRRTSAWSHTMSLARAQPVASAAVAIAVIGIATIVGAFFFQYGLGLPPCPLCLEQRLRLLRLDPARRADPARRLGRRLAQGGAAGARRDRGLHALECRPRRLSFRRRMGWWAGSAGLRRAADRYRRRAATCSSSCRTCAWCAATRPHGASSACRSQAIMRSSR